MALWTPANIANASTAVLAFLDTSVADRMLTSVPATAVDTDLVATFINRTEAASRQWVQATTNDKPVLNGTNKLNGVNVLEFNGTGVPAGYNSNAGPDFMTQSSTTWGLTWTCVALVQPINNIGTYARIFDQDASAGMMLGTNSSGVGFTSFCKNVEADVGTVVGIALGNWFVVCTRFDGTNVQTRVNGATYTASAAASAPSSSTRTCHIMQAISGGQGLGCRLRSLVYTTDSSVGTRDQIEGWTAWQNGNGNLLDSGHTYKNAAPTTGGSVHLLDGGNQLNCPLLEPGLITSQHRHQRLWTPRRKQIVVPAWRS